MSLIPQEQIDKKVEELMKFIYIKGDNPSLPPESAIYEFLNWYNEQLIEEIRNEIRMLRDPADCPRYNFGYNHAIDIIACKLKDQSLLDND